MKFSFTPVTRVALALLCALFIHATAATGQDSPWEGASLLELECTGVGENLLLASVPGASRGVAVVTGAVFDSQEDYYDSTFADYVRIDLSDRVGSDNYNFYLRTGDRTNELWVRWGGRDWSPYYLGDVRGESGAWKWRELALSVDFDTEEEKVLDIAFYYEGQQIDQLYIEPSNGPGDRNGIFPNNLEGNNCADFTDAPPVAILEARFDNSGGREIYSPENLLMIGEGSYDPDGGPVSYYYSPSGRFSNDFSPYIDVKFDEGDGDFTVGLIVYDFYGNRSSDFQLHRSIPYVYASERTTFRFSPVCAVAGPGWTFNQNDLTGDDRSSYDAPPADLPENRIAYVIPNLSAEDAGKYYLTGSFDGGDTDSEEEDCLWVRINGENWQEWKILDKSLSFLPDFGFRLGAGSNTFEFAYCSPNLTIEEFIVRPDTYYYEDEGPINLVDLECTNGPQAWLDAECADYGSAWRAIEDTAAANGGYLVVKGLNSMNTPPADDPANRISFDLKDANLTVGEPLYLYARIDAPTNLDDSFWVRLNGGQWYAWKSGIRQGRGFVWNRFPGALTAGAGENILDFAYREDGTKIDRIFFSQQDKLPESGPAVGGNCPVRAQTVAIEAECGFINEGWRERSSSTASNDKYVSFPGKPNFSPPSGEGENRLEYIVEAPVGGVYTLFGRLNAPDPGRNSFWARVDHGPWIKWWTEADGSQLLTDGFEWREVNNDGRAMTFSLFEGFHTITIANREPGTQLDKLQLSRVGKLPTGFGAPAPSCEVNAPFAVSPPSPGSAVRITDDATETVNLYPNPTADRIRVEWKHNFLGEVSLTVFDMTGRTVKVAVVPKPAEDFRTDIDVTGLPAGIYRLRLLAADHQEVRAFTKQ